MPLINCATVPRQNSESILLHSAKKKNKISDPEKPQIKNFTFGNINDLNDNDSEDTNFTIEDGKLF